MKRKYTSWEEAMNLREVKVRAMQIVVTCFVMRQNKVKR